MVKPVISDGAYVGSELDTAKEQPSEAANADTRWFFQRPGMSSIRTCREQQRNQQVIDDTVLAYDHLPDIVANGVQRGLQSMFISSKNFHSTSVIFPGRLT